MSTHDILIGTVSSQNDNNEDSKGQKYMRLFRFYIIHENKCCVVVVVLHVFWYSEKKTKIQPFSWAILGIFCFFPRINLSFIFYCNYLRLTWKMENAIAVSALSWVSSPTLKMSMPQLFDWSRICNRAKCKQISGNCKQHYSDLG